MKHLALIIALVWPAAASAQTRPEIGLATTFAVIDKDTGKVEQMAGKKFFCLNRAVDSKTAGIAHRWWPCNTRVLLVNIRTGKTTVARVIDRGPYWNVPGRCATDAQGRFPSHACWAKGYPGAGEPRAGYVRGNVVDVTPPVARALRLRGKEPVIAYPLPTRRYRW